jgi:hypothetical protein
MCECLYNSQKKIQHNFRFHLFGCHSSLGSLPRTSLHLGVRDTVVDIESCVVSWDGAKSRQGGVGCPCGWGARTSGEEKQRGQSWREVGGSSNKSGGRYVGAGSKSEKYAGIRRVGV